MQVVHVKGQLAHALGIGGEGVLEVEAACDELVVVRLKRGPLGRGGGVDGCLDVGHESSFPELQQMGLGYRAARTPSVRERQSFRTAHPAAESS